MVDARSGYICPECGFTGESAEQLEAHYFKEHKTIQAEAPRESQDDERTSRPDDCTADKIDFIVELLLERAQHMS